MQHTIRNALGATVVGLLGLVAWLVNQQAVRDESARYVALKIKAWAATQPVPTYALSPVKQVRPDLANAPAATRELVESAESLGPIDVTAGDVKSHQARLVRFVQRGGDAGAGEYIEIEALQDLDLSNGSLGDASRPVGSPHAIPLPADLRIRAGERVRIFTTRNPQPVKVVELGQGKGIFKGSSHKADRVWLANSAGGVVLDFHYKVK